MTQREHAFERLGVSIACVAATNDAPVERVVDMLGSVLGPLSSGSPSPDPGPLLTIHVHLGAQPRPAGPPSFFHGTVEGHMTDGRCTLVAAGAAVHVHGGDRIDVVVPTDDAANLGVPLFIGVAVALRHHGLFHLHAAGIHDERMGSVLVVGQQGAGKTSTCLSLVEAGGSFIGDDAVFLALREEAVVAHGVPRAFHLGARTRAAFPRLGALCTPGETLEKLPLDAARAWPGRGRASLDGPFTLVFPHISERVTTMVERIDPAEAFGLLLESSALGVVEGMVGLEAQLAILQLITSSARAVRLSLGADALMDPARAAACIAQFASSS